MKFRSKICTPMWRKRGSSVEDNPINNDARRKNSGREIEKVRLCPMCCRLHPADWFEEHHLVCKANCPYLTMGICKNCHRFQHVKLLDAGVTGEVPETWPHQVMTILRAWAVVFQSLADLCWELADKGVQYLAGLANQQCKTKVRKAPAT